MKPILATTVLLLALTACDTAHTAASTECDRHRLSAAEHADCVAKLQSSETQLRKAQ